MKNFKTDLKLDLLPGSGDDKRTWIVLEPFEYTSPKKNKTFTVPKGFITDLASVPRIPLIYLLFGGTAIEAAVVHDYLYSYPKQVTRIFADFILREASINSGVQPWRAYGIWFGVRIAGWLFFNKKPRTPPTTP